MAGKLTGRQKIEARTEEIAAPVAAEYGVEIYDVSYDKEGKEYFLNVYIDKEGGVNILDCENVSRKLSDLLDEEDYIQDAYTLIVSSPGLGRTLTKDRHLQHSLGEKVEIRLYRPLAGTAVKDLVGTLVDFDAETVRIEYDPGEGPDAHPKSKKGGSKKTAKAAASEEPGSAESGALAIARKDIAVIRQYVEW